MQQGVDQVNKQAERSDTGDDVIHIVFLLQLVAGLGEGPGDKQDHAPYSDVE